MLKSLGIGAILLAVVPAGALSQTPQRLDPRIADLVEAGKLRIGVFPSFQYSKDAATGQPRGLAMEIANALASRRLSRRLHVN
jgi:ABC-type amino acid transport substrate-binding protein